jgi:hypothetical protein
VTMNRIAVLKNLAMLGSGSCSGAAAFDDVRLPGLSGVIEFCSSK